MHNANDCFHSNQQSLSILSPRTAKKLICCNKTRRSHRQDAFLLQEQHSFPISFSLAPKAPVVFSGIRSPYRNGSLDPYREAESLMRNGFVPFTRRGHDLGNSIRDETWHISSIPLGCSPINLKKCNGQPIRRKWPSNFGDNLYTSNSSREISAQMSARSRIIRKVCSSVLAEVSLILFFSKLFQLI
ncbi:hypothetical protein AVEN_104912-1 [Araneus ventricosus]|uniref:Uncharacterized protein n=1 Tax=Araneus ventricosus TaxID=182803 RepID=A0A4Y2KTQ7_ARAVE|nr:hypothetical protein AVEN_104912-1 [Araneus ventricosus]